MEIIRQEKVFNIPNLLTFLRITLLPVVVWRFLYTDYRGALLFYSIAMLTDLLDGAAARKLNQITALGKLLDPVADKLFLLTMLALFVSDKQIPAWVLRIVLLKEGILLAGSCAALGRGIVVSALPIGKVTTVVFILSVLARFLSWSAVADVLLGLFLLLSLAALAWYSVVLIRDILTQKTAT